MVHLHKLKMNINLIIKKSNRNNNFAIIQSGKRMHRLAENLQQITKALTHKLERKRRQWEAASQRDNSSDPLSIWLKYIKWIKLTLLCFVLHDCFVAIYFVFVFI
eukprot:358032_1